MNRNENPNDRSSRSTATVRDASAQGLRKGPLTLLMLLIGVWLFVCLWILDYPSALRGPHLVELGASIVVIIAAIVRMSRPVGRFTDYVVMAIGAGLVLAAFLGDYRSTVATDMVRVNQAASGAALVLVALTSAVLAVRSRSASPSGDADSDSH
ncbi:hypothetical protein QNO09_39090 [Streptomyces sp. 378]|uniref:SPW repeat domain-containing protein n=1 Tax=Streptomyces sp. 378 TaxID=3049412 RepID=UPI0024C2D768|nr:hypothetical protein [Streptomyces sp. 378]MDK1349143.1 hypothetical protein [Streptomyces sp. 378]